MLLTLLKPYFSALGTLLILPKSFTEAFFSNSESISSMAEKELLSNEVEADIFFIIVPAIALISRNVTVEGERETAVKFIYNCRATKPGVVINAIALFFQSKLKSIIVD